MPNNKIPCGGFYLDSEIFRLYKNTDGYVTLGVQAEALKGVQGAKGDKGDPFTISKIYTSVSAMEADHDNPDIEMDSFVLIESGTGSEPDDGKLYIKDVHGFDYITNLSGAQGIKGEKGETGVGVPTGGSMGEFLMKNHDAEDYVTAWEDISGNLLPTITDEEDNGKFAQIVNGEWTAQHFEHGQIIHAASTMNVMGYAVPRLTAEQTNTIYNSYIAGKNVIISSADGKHHYHVISVDGSDADNITAKVLYEDKIILTYNKFGVVSDYTPLLDKNDQVVTLSREYGTAQNDHGYYREWSPNLQGKVWVECGVFITTVALSVGSRVPLPVTFEDENFHVQVTVLELGSYNAVAYRSGSRNAINVQTHDYYGTPKAVKICVEAKGWKKLD